MWNENEDLSIKKEKKEKENTPNIKDHCIFQFQKEKKKKRKEIHNYKV